MVDISIISRNGRLGAFCNYYLSSCKKRENIIGIDIKISFLSLLFVSKKIKIKRTILCGNNFINYLGLTQIHHSFCLFFLFCKKKFKLESVSVSSFFNLVEYFSTPERDYDNLSIPSCFYFKFKIFVNIKVGFTLKINRKLNFKPQMVHVLNHKDMLANTAIKILFMFHFMWTG